MQNPGYVSSNRIETIPKIRREKIRKFAGERYKGADRKVVQKGTSHTRGVLPAAEKKGKKLAGRPSANPFVLSTIL